MKKFQIAGRYGYATASDMYRLLGTTDHLPVDGMSERLIQGVRVYVKPLPRYDRGRRQSLRVTAICECGAHIAVGRMHQHVCKQSTPSWDVYWSPEGRKIATVLAHSARQAIRKAPQPYRQKLGELYAVETPKEDTSGV